MSLDITTFNCSNIGANTVTLSVRDTSNQLSTCTATVTVEDPAQNAVANIVADNNPICAGEDVTFSIDSTIDSGATPIYEWFVNGISEAANISTFTPISPLSNGDQVYVEMQSSLSACSIPKQSNIITMTVNPLPIVSGPASLCMGSNGYLTPGTSGWVSTSGFATVNGFGTVTPTSSGIATFTFTDANGCTSDLSITINDLPLIGNLPSDNEMCVNNTHTLSPTTGGVWTTTDTSIATITSAGDITAIASGVVSFVFTDTNGCNVTTASIQVLNIPAINSITASNDPVCAGDQSILTINAVGAGDKTTLINYNFNSGDNYSELNGQEPTGITSSVNGAFPFIRPNQEGVVTFPGAFTQNTIGGGILRQYDDWQDGDFFWTGGADDSGYWSFDIGGTNLPNYQDFRIYFQIRRVSSLGLNKSATVDYRVNGGTWVTNFTTVQLPTGANNWIPVTFTLPASVDNPNNLELRLNVNDGSDFNWEYDSATDTYNAFNEATPHVHLDNFQVQGTTAINPFTYSWTANTGLDAGLPAGSNTPSYTNDQITVTPNVTTDYTVTVLNSNGCSETQTITVNVYPSPDITVSVDYCPADDLSTAQDESNMVQLVANASLPISSWEWITGETTQTIYVATAGNYQVIGTTPNGCSEAYTISVAQELIVNGNFSQGNVGFTSDYNYVADQPGLVPVGQGELFDDSGNNGYSIAQNGQDVNINFWGLDHTSDGAPNFMIVNGHGNTLAVWKQTITVEPNTDYFFSAWAMSLNNIGPFAQLTFNINGTNVGSAPVLTAHPNDNNPGSDNWVRFNGIWNSGANTSANIEIQNLQASASGNDFGLDDIAFATLSTFINLTSAVGTVSQTVCQNLPIVDITYDVGGGLTAPSIIGLPTGLTTSFDGLEFIISGTPTEFGTFNYTLTTTSSCDIKSATGTIVVEEAPEVVIQVISSPICYGNGNIAVNSTLSGSASSGTWTTSGNGNFTGISVDGSTGTYNFGVNESGTITLTFTSNDPIGSCVAAIDTYDIEITPYFIANAGVNIDNSAASCADLSVTLAANNVAGQWSVTSAQDPSTYFFSDITTYNSTFTGESGENYTLQWEATNTGVCNNTTDVITVIFADCGNNLVFDGTEDYISFANNYDLNATAFSIEGWINPDNLNGTKTIISKRNSTNLNSGYDLTLINHRLYFRWNNQQMFSTAVINNSKWYHVAVTFDGANTYTMYIDGFEVRTNSTGSSPAVNSNKSMIGAMDTTNNNPINYFNGAIDEVRIWNTELSENQIREMMNQQIEANGTNVSGVVVQMDITGLQWNNLVGYYQMLIGPQSNIANGNIQDISTISSVQGKLNKMTGAQVENAPIPYISGANGDWDNQATWLNGSVQQIPNSRTNSITGAEQTWNIVRITTDVTTNRPNIIGSTTINGLFIDNNRLSIGNDQSIYVEKYIKIDGTLNLVGESQLIQPMGSIVDYTGTGQLERDQQGTANLYNYNYWTSPVSSNGTTFTIAGTLYDGTTVSNPQPLNWTNSFDADPSTTPKTLSRRWLYLYENYLENSYADWNLIDENNNIPVGLGYTMKGSGSPSANQNYTFVGQPNNGTISSPVSANFQALIGNPYPSAIDANTFILDNSAVLLDGALSFWEHAPSNGTHLLLEYQGGYAVRNLSGGLPAVSPPEINGEGNANQIPGRYVPVAQGFYVTGNATGGTITFNNTQRIFRTEATASSVFLRNATATSTTDDNDTLNKSVRIDFITPENAVRHLLLAFIENGNATDAIDYGYDALNTESFPNDMSFSIEDEKFLIQGVGNFDVTKSYPLDIDITNGGPIQIALNTIENFEENIDVFIYDALLENYTRINNLNFQLTLEAGNYSNRFYLVFQEDTTLSIIKQNTNAIAVNFLQNTDEIYIKTPSGIDVKQLYLINILGQTVASWNSTNLPLSNEIKVPVKDVSEGSYVLKVETNFSTVNKKILIKY